MAVTTTFTLTPLATPISVNTTTTGNQFSSDIVHLAGGSNVIAYGNSTNLFIRPLDANGTPTGAEVTVAAGIDTSVDHFANMAVLTNGNIVVTWADNAATRVVHYRIYDPSLTPVTGVLDVTSPDRWKLNSGARCRGADRRRLRHCLPVPVRRRGYRYLCAAIHRCGRCRWRQHPDQYRRLARPCAIHRRACRWRFRYRASPGQRRQYRSVARDPQRRRHATPRRHAVRRYRHGQQQMSMSSRPAPAAIRLTISTMVGAAATTTSPSGRSLPRGPMQTSGGSRHRRPMTARSTQPSLPAASP